MAGLKVVHDSLPDGLLVLGAVIAAGQAEGQNESGDNAHLSIIPVREARYGPPKCNNEEVRLPDGQSLPATGEESPVSTGRRAG